MKQTMSVREAADLFGISVAAVRARMRSGELPIGRVVNVGSYKSYMIYTHLVQKELGYEEDR